MEPNIPNFRIGLSLALAHPPESLIHVGIRQDPGFFQLWHAVHVSSAMFIDACAPEVQWAEEQLLNVPEWKAELRLLGAENGEKEFFIASKRTLNAIHPAEALHKIGIEEKTVEVSTLHQTTLSALLSGRSWPASTSLTWLVVDCMPALPVLRGAGAYLNEWSVIRCEVLVDDAAADIPEARLSEVTGYLQKLGYRRAIVTESWSPAIKTAWFVRDWRAFALQQIAAKSVVAQVQERPRGLAAENSTLPEIRALRAEVELIRHELSVAQRTGHLGAHATDEGSLQQKTFSQLGQDLWVVQRLGVKRVGFFVDIGATDGVLLNNTYLLEKQYDWRGICIEPSQNDYRALQRNRTCMVSDACVWSVTGEEMEFILAKEYGGLAAVADDDMHAAKRQAYRELGEVVRVRTTSLNDLLRDCNAPAEIDYISLDVEGAEFDILNTFDFAKWSVSVWTVEHNYAPQRTKIRALMEQHGYACQEAEWDDWYFRVDS